jgi:hypothetical protein
MLTNATTKRLLSSTLTYYGTPVTIETVGSLGLRFSCVRPVVGRLVCTTLDGYQYAHPGKSAGYRNREANKIFALWCIRAVNIARDLAATATAEVLS